MRTKPVQHVNAAQKYNKRRKTPTTSSLRTSPLPGQDTPLILAPALTPGSAPTPTPPTTPGLSSNPSPVPRVSGATHCLLLELRLLPQLRMPLQSAREAALAHFRLCGIGTLTPGATFSACASTRPREEKQSQEIALGSYGTGPTQRRHDGSATSDLGPPRKRAGHGAEQRVVRPLAEPWGSRSVRGTGGDGESELNR